jgi:beta-barrel assembly-enhancing protease
MKSTKIIISSILTLALFAGCKKGGVKDFLFPVEKDIELGKQLADYIDAHPEEYPLVDSAKNTALYNAMYSFRNVILNSGKVKHKDDFAWRVRVIDEPNTLNAFAAPGGFIYIYTGIIKYLDKPEHFAGVMGHELAHAAERHSINQMIKTNGVQILLEIALGNDNGIAKVATGLASLKFSRSDEKEADEKSIEYLCGSAYEANGAAGFFEKLIAEESTGSTPEFLSTHPSPENRVENINSNAQKMGCSISGSKEDWTKIKDLASNIKK